MSKWWSLRAARKGIRYKRREGIGTSSRRCDNTPILFLSPLFIPSLYRCPIECNLWKSVPQSCPADFRGVGRKPPRRRQWPSIPPPPLSSHRTRSRPQQFLIPSTLATRWTWGKESWEDGDGLRSLLERRRGCSALIPAARFRSQFSRALTRLLSLPASSSSIVHLFLFHRISASFAFLPSLFRRWGAEDHRWKEAQKIQLAVDWPPNRFCTTKTREEKERLEKVEERGCSSISYSQTRLIWKYNSPAWSQYRVTIDERIVFWFMSRYFAGNVSNDLRSIIRDLELSDFMVGRRISTIACCVFCACWHILTVIGKTMTYD